MQLPESHDITNKLRYLYANTSFMKRIILCGLLLVSNAVVWAQGSAMDLLDAKKRGKLQINVRGSYNPNQIQPNLVSSYYGKCIDIRLQNMTDSTLHLVLNSGTVLLSKDTTVQNMVVTQTQRFLLAPKQQKIDRLFAMCGQKPKSSPDIYVRYEVGQLGNPQMVRLANVIESNQAQNKAGQYAMWAVTDRNVIPSYESPKLAISAQELLTKAQIDFDITGKNIIASAPNTVSYGFPQLAPEPQSYGEAEQDSVTLVPQDYHTQTYSLSASYETAKLTNDSTSEVILGISVVALLAFSLYFYQKRNA